MLGRAVCSSQDSADARACRADKLAAWFTDFEWLLSTFVDLLPWLPGKRKKVCGAAPGAAADRIHPPTVPGHQGDRPGTPGATSTASDGSDGRSGARDGNLRPLKGLNKVCPFNVALRLSRSNDERGVSCYYSTENAPKTTNIDGL